MYVYIYIYICVCVYVYVCIYMSCTPHYVRSQVGNVFIMQENIRSFGKFFDEFHSFASELNRAADVIVFSETLFSANICHGVQG